MAFTSRSISRIVPGSDIETLNHTSYDDDNRLHFPGAVRKFAYQFDGHGKFVKKPWNLTSNAVSEGFSWYHVELPRSSQKLFLSAEYLIDVLCPPLKLQEILALVSSGPFCGTVEGALIFRVNSAGPCASKFTQRISALVTENRVISVSLGRLPRLDFSGGSASSLLSEVPCIEPREGEGEGWSHLGRTKYGGFVIQEHVLEFLLTRNTLEEAENAVPRGVGNLLVHIVDTHVDQLHEIVLHLETQLDEVEREMDTGVGATKKQMLDDRRYPKMHLNLQRLLQVVAHGDQVFPRVKDKCAGKAWCSSEDLATLEALVGRLRKLKENVGFTVSRITAIQAGLDSWQAEQINRKLYYLSFLSMMFLPLSIVTGAFGMNVGGVPWTMQTNPQISHGFRNVMLICAAIVLLLLVLFGAMPLYNSLGSWRSRGAHTWGLRSHKSIRYRGGRHPAYVPL